MAGGVHKEVRGIFQKPGHLNQTGFYPSHNNFLKTTFLKSQPITAFPKVIAQPNTPYKIKM
jgi:hypothetical protein